jgi:hypothetical protein
VRIINLKEHNILENQISVEEVHQVRGPIMENQLGVQVQEVAINYIHCTEVIIQQVSKWQE